MWALRPTPLICSATSSSWDLAQGRNDNVSTGFRECQRHRRPEPAARAGHYRYLVVQPKSVPESRALSFRRLGRTLAILDSDGEQF